MKRYKRNVYVNILIATLCIFWGCASPDRVVFVTSTEIGIGADAKVGNANIGYDRNELVLEPSYPETGATAPVYGSLDSNLEIFHPRVKQLYATGKAAELVTDFSPTPTPQIEKPKLSGTRRLMIFGTSSNIGLKIHTDGMGIDGINFGYKRKELSVIPLRKEDPSPNKEDKYVSTIAGIGIDISTSGFATSGMRLSQFMATGSAAENIARQSQVKEAFRQEAIDGFGTAVTSGMVKGIALNEQTNLILKHVTNDNSLDKMSLDGLFNKAEIKDDDANRKFIEQAKSLEDLKGRLEVSRDMVGTLYKVLP